ncbi:MULTISPECIES: hypothetical protein [Arcobacter]|uniref:Uncharacterized protein n=1 Tax=Arcobacter ellisii TaxID=913109 RepID=A0A347U8I4_9BACT|nr:MULTISPECIES: hypothetical protein [Arcobacter]AXX95162.1 hypothetical protein AELL_1502 [Arcobacter ellisii]MDD3008592.1 hypothetical protein [Arcobacter sp.]RXI30184.1 hypothetical protein CP962_09270 [Arcobacter ellisii]
MASKKYIVKQTIAHNGKAEKTATITVPCDDETELSVLVNALDGIVEVYEQNLTLSAGTNSASTSFVTADSIKMRHKGAETVYISAFNRPLVFKSSVNVNELAETLKATIKPFAATEFLAAKPQDVSIDTGDIRKL